MNPSINSLTIDRVGFRQRVAVYHRLTGYIVWFQPWWMPSYFALRCAAKVMKERRDGEK